MSASCFGLHNTRVFVLRVAACFAVGALVLATVQAMAQSREAGAAQSLLPEVIISATRSERTVDDVPASVTVISKEQIRNTPGDSIDEVLRTVPGLELPIATSYQLHPTSNFPGMMGSKSALTSHILVMVDGVPINDAYEGFVQWNRVPKENVERVEIVRGGGASLWGTYALSGIVNIITRTPAQKQYSADVGYGSFGTYRADFYGTPIFTDALKLSLSYNRYNTNGFDQIVPGRPTPGFFVRPANNFTKTSFNSNNFQAVANYKIDPTLYGLVRLNYHDNAQPDFVLLPMSTSQETLNFDLQVNKILGNGAKLAATAFRNHGVFRTNNASYNDNFPIVTPADQGEPFLSNNHRATADDWGGSLIWQKNLSRYVPSASVGLDFRQIQAKEHVDNFTRVFGVPVSVFDAVNSGDFKGKQSFVGAFTQISIFPTEKLEIAPSLRVQQWNNYDGFVLQAVNPADKGPQASKTVYDVSSRVSVRYEATSVLALRGAVYKSFNAPTLDNLYRTFSANGFTIFSNPNLNPEKLYGGEAGFDVNTARSKSSFTLFQNSILDYIAFAGDATNTNFLNQNLGRVRARGLLASSDLTLSERVSLRLGYTYTESSIVSSDLHPDWIGEQLAFIPKNRFDAALTYKATNIRATLLGRYFSKSYGVNGLQFDTIAGTTTLRQSAYEQDAHTVFDANVAYTISKTAEAYVNVANMFGRKYVANNDGFAPPLFGTPRTVFAGVRVKFD